MKKEGTIRYGNGVTVQWAVYDPTATTSEIVRTFPGYDDKPKAEGIGPFIRRTATRILVTRFLGTRKEIR